MNGGYGSSGYGSSGYGSGYNSYGSGYGSGYGSSYGTGYGSSYGSSYGAGYGSSYGTGMGYGMGMGMGSYGMSGLGSYGGAYNRYSPYSRYGMNPGMQGMPGGPMGEPSLAAQMAQSTQSTFQILERVVGTFGGVAQMLESTFFATQSSFMAMVGVAEQFGMLKQMLSQIFSVFAIYRWVRNFLYRVAGKRPPIDPREISAKEFQQFSEKPSYSYRPFLMFLALVFGVPYLLHLFMRSVARRLAQQQQDYLKKQSQIMDGAEGGNQTFEFAQATHDFRGQNPSELVFSKGDLIAILNKGAPGAPSANQAQWWQGRLRDGRVGMFPSNYVEILEKKVDLSDPISSQGPMPNGGPSLANYGANPASNFGPNQMH